MEPNFATFIMHLLKKKYVSDDQVYQATHLTGNIEHIGKMLILSIILKKVIEISDGDRNDPILSPLSIFTKTENTI